MAVSQQQWIDATKEAIKRIKANSCYGSAVHIANSVSKGSLYLAGGKLYRTIAEVLYGGDFGSVGADWDFVSLDTATSQLYSSPFWNITRGPGISPASPKFNTNGSTAKIGQNLQLNRSWRFEYTGNSKLSIDVVAIEDIISGGSIIDYLDSVPLSIQALALVIRSAINPVCNGTLIGAGGEVALRDKVVHWNNQAKLKPLPAQSPDLYFTNKLASLPGFMDGRNPSSMVQNVVKVINQTYIPFVNPAYIKYEPKVSIKNSYSKECSCSSFDLFSKGCKCGAVIPYDANATAKRNLGC